MSDSGLYNITIQYPTFVVRNMHIPKDSHNVSSYLTLLLKIYMVIQTDVLLK